MIRSIVSAFVAARTQATTELFDCVLSAPNCPLIAEENVDEVKLEEIVLGLVVGDSSLCSTYFLSHGVVFHLADDAMNLLGDLLDFR